MVNGIADGPVINWDEQGQPISHHFGDIYFSKESGLDETQHVFLNHNHLFERFGDLVPHQVFTIGETGFGTGLNFLMTWQLWQNTAHQDARLHFISVEKYPLSPAQLQQALALWPALQQYAQALMAHYPFPAENKINRLYFASGRVQLTLIFDDATEGLKQYLPHQQCGVHVNNSGASYGLAASYVDAWFLDGFSPSKNPDMWTASLYQSLAKLSRKNTTLATFTSAGHVRRGLQAAGFTMAKQPGFGHKREMLSGIWQGTDEHTATEPQSSNQPSPPKRYAFAESWHLYPYKPPRPQNIVVIGAGLAGCHTARALAERGFNVTVVDAAKTIAAGASGNPQGVVYTRFSHETNALAQFNVAALRFADAFYAQGYYGDVGAQTGVFQQEENAEARAQAQRTTAAEVAAKYQSNTRFAHYMATSEAKTRVCEAIIHPGLLTEHGGWMRPDALCAKLLEHANIQVRLEHSINALHYQPNHKYWQLDVIGASTAAITADAVIVATATAATQLAQAAALPAKNIRGQMTFAHLPRGQTTAVTAPVCGDGYVAPMFLNNQGQSTLCFGATFDVKNHNPTATIDDNHKNLAMLTKMLPSFELPTELRLQGRASFRCSTPDYLPLIGPIPEVEAFKKTFGDYRKNKNWRIDALGDYHPNLFINIGHGSRGLAYTALAAELLACLITGEPLPLEEALYKHCHPARFIVRNLIRNKI